MRHVSMPGIAWPVIEEPLDVSPISKVAVPGEVVELGGGTYDLELTADSETVRAEVVDGRLDTTGLPPARYRVKAVRGSQTKDAGTLYLVASS
jgi:hypothetical protein